MPQRVRRVLSLEVLEDNAKQELNRCLIEAVRAELEGRGLEYFFVLFHGDRAIHEPGPYTWRERFLHETLVELGIPFVSTKRAFLEDHARTGRWAEDWFIPEGLGRNHYVPEANAIAFEAMRRGLRGRFETRTYMRRAPEHPKTSRER